MIAVTTSAAAAAAIAYAAVDASPHAPPWRGARTGMLNSHRHTRMPTRACPVDHVTGSRSQIRIEATSTVAWYMKSRLS
jgi:hypothetical protein